MRLMVYGIDDVCGPDLPWSLRPGRRLLHALDGAPVDLVAASCHVHQALRIAPINKQLTTITFIALLATD